MKLNIRVKNRIIELNTDEGLTPVEASYIEAMIENDILQLEKETPDTIKILSSLVVKYCVEYFVTKKKLQNISTNLEEKIDNLVLIIKEHLNNEKLF
ncbi:MAG: hypothetical protein N2Z20_04225 [Elusimicrobiales bacterium]|nr:hypothetical protein [Elusimicrobiales bacterium]